MAKWIHELAPKDYTHRNIVFAGGLGEFWNWLPIEGISEAVNDANYQLCAFWACLRDDDSFEEFVDRVNACPLSEPHFKVCAARSGLEAIQPSHDIVGAAIAFFVKYRQSRQGLGKDYVTPTSRVRRGMNEQVSAWLSAVDGLPECHERLRRVEIRNMDCIDFIEAYDHKNALFYLDPPYVHESRSTTTEFGDNEMADEKHIALLDRLLELEGKFMLSGYPSAMYQSAADHGGWSLHTKVIDNKASSKKEKPNRIECLWTNY